MEGVIQCKREKALKTSKSMLRQLKDLNGYGQKSCNILHSNLAMADNI
jgi:hypothetical protein